MAIKRQDDNGLWVIPALAPGDDRFGNAPCVAECEAETLLQPDYGYVLNCLGNNNQIIIINLR